MQTGVHCKVECNTEIRRFLFNGTEFTSLYEQIKNLFSVQKEFVLKYKDEEGDMITLSTTEELSFAVSSLLPSQAFRLVVIIKETSTMPNIDIRDQRRGGKWRGGCGGDLEGKKRRMQAYLEKLQAMPTTDDKAEWRLRKIEHLQMKIAYVESMQTTNNAPQSEVFGPNRWALKLQGKKEKITAKLEKLSQIPQNEGNVEWRAKEIERLKVKLAWVEAKQAKIGEKGRCPKREWGPEQKVKMQENRAQMIALKEKMFALKEQIQNKKSEYHLAPKESKEKVENEMKELKGQMRALKDQMFTLRANIHRC